MTADDFTNIASGPGWYEFMMPGGSTTHIAYAYEDGSVYLPEGPDVVDEIDFRLAASSERFWKLVRATQEPTDAEVEAARRAADDHRIVTKRYRNGEIRWRGCETCDVEIRDYDEQDRHELRAALSAARAARQDEEKR